MHLTYYVQKNEERYEPFYTYKEGAIDPNEIYARQLCEYLVLNGMQYQLLSNEMNGSEEMLVVKELGPAIVLPDEVSYEGQGICLEFREYKSSTDLPLLYTMRLQPRGKGHWDILRYLLKDHVEVPTVGICQRDCAELDEDRRCYVLYVIRST